MRAQPRASHFIDGCYVEDTSGAALTSIYPATGEVIARIHEATPAIIERAIASAISAQKNWAKMRPAERGRILCRAASLIRERNRELSELETLDTGKPLQETLIADAASGADALEYFGGIAGAITGQHIDLGGGDFVYTRREPLGLCAGIGAWNYPTQIACWKAAPALVCGNAMIFKPSEMTPLGALKLAEILMEAGLPAGLFNVIQGGGNTGLALIAHPAMNKISLTGSVPTGKLVMAEAGRNIKHTTMELGGKSPLIVFEDAELEDAISGAMLGNFYSAGQVCSNGTRVFVHRSIKDRFLARLTERTANIRIGDPLDETTQMGPLISAQQMHKVLDYIALGKEQGARLVHGRGRIDVEGCENGYFVEPAIFAEVTDHMRIAREEIFGPIMCVLGFEDEDEVIARANATEFGLAAGIFTKDLARAHRVAASIQAGICWINSYNLTPVEAPFGGTKQSGAGRENSMAAIEHYSQLKSVYVASGPVESPY